MSGYTSGNKAPTLMAQAPNRKGNVSKHVTGPGGATAVTRPEGNTAYAADRQGAPSAGGNIAGRNQKVQVSRPASNYGCNDDYRNSDRNNYLK